MSEGSPLEEQLVAQIAEAGLPPPDQRAESKRAPWAHTKRRFIGDLVWPEARLLVEVNGGIYTGGRHITPSGYDRDCVKYALATLAGWRVLYVTSAHVKNGFALNWIGAALGAWEAESGMTP